MSENGRTLVYFPASYLISKYVDIEIKINSAKEIEYNNKGQINISDLKSSIKKETILVSIMAVNNEIGSIQDIKGVKVDYTDGLTVEYAKKIGATHLVRGIRTVTDFEYEFSLAAANKFIDKSIDIVFFMANSESSIISSSSVDQLVKAGIDISNLVPESVVKMYQQKK